MHADSETEDLARSKAGRAGSKGADTRRHGPYTLSGPLDRTGIDSLPVRGDLAHIGLAGRCFVPHFAAPQPRAVMPGGATLHVAPDGSSREVCAMLEGESFEVLDVTGEWAWGCLSLEGPSGYVRADRLEALA